MLFSKDTINALLTSQHAAWALVGFFASSTYYSPINFCKILAAFLHSPTATPWLKGNEVNHMCHEVARCQSSSNKPARLVGRGELMPSLSILKK